MLGIDGPEFIVIILVLIVVIGPKDLPKMLRTFGKVTARMRATANEFRRQFDDAMREAELDDLQKTMSDVANLDPRKSLAKVFDPIRDVAKDVRTSLDVKNNFNEIDQLSAQNDGNTIVHPDLVGMKNDIPVPQSLEIDKNLTARKTKIKPKVQKKSLEITQQISKKTTSVKKPTNTKTAAVKSAKKTIVSPLKKIDTDLESTKTIKTRKKNS